MAPNNIIIIQGEKEKKNGIHYEIDPSCEPIGKGGTGVVRIGQMVDEKTGVRRDVAIKFLYDDMPQNILVRSQREASIRVLSENLVEMIDFVQIDETDALGRTIVHSHVVSELLHGVMLLDILKGITTDKDGNEVQAAREYYDLMLADRNQFAIKIVRNVLSGIQALHDNGYIHRDIDPSNIMITDRGKVKLIDLGIAKKIDNMQQPAQQHLTSTGQFIGKAAYAAPELVLGDLANQNETTDIYAIGIMLYLLVVGKLPFNGPLQEILHMQCNEKMPVQDIKDKNIRKIVKTATEKRQADRYQSAAEFRVAVDAANRQLRTAAPQPTAPSTAAPDASLSGTAIPGTIVPGTSAPASAPSPSAVTAPAKPKTNTLLYICIAAVAVFAIGAAAFFLGGSDAPAKEEAQEELVNTESAATTVPDGDASETASTAPATTVPDAAPSGSAATASDAPAAAPAASPSGSAATTPAPAPAEEKAPAPKPAPASSDSGMKLSYGKYTGSVKNGYPNGKGKLVYTTSRRINKYDPKGIVAQPGEYVEGMFVNGFLTVGKHYSVDGELLNKISAGVAEGVYESK